MKLRDRTSFESSDDLCKYAAEVGEGQAILNFSTGKDSLAAWLFMRKYFDRIVPIYLWSVPRMSFVEKSLAYYEDYFETRIIRLPHPSLYRMLNGLVMQAPENCQIVEEANLPTFDYQDINQIVREDCQMPQECLAASGVRARDSINRWSSIKKYGPLNYTKKTFYPIFDFDKARMVNILLSSGVRLPVDYRMFGRSFDGIDYRFSKPIKEHYPEDYKKLLALFPLADLDIFRIECREKYYASLGEIQNAEK